MAPRKKIAVWYSYQEGWIGGTYYIQNLVQALNTLGDTEKPVLIIVCRSDEEFEQIQQTHYTYLEKWLYANCDFEGGLNKLERLINKITRFFLNHNSIQRPARVNYPGTIDTFFPCPELKPFEDVLHPLYWIPDFQEMHLPQFFDAAQLRRRRSIASYIANNAQPVLFSSHDALHDFNTAFPGNRSKTFVVPFAVTHPDLSEMDIAVVKNKYGLAATYFFAPNQFWKHKDHLTLIKAAQFLIESKKDAGLQIVFSGKEDDFRNPGYVESLKKYVLDHHLEDHILFLGFIDRVEQLLIMKYARAIVQPSLFEGWSTVIEDAKAMSQCIIASDLEVHREQLKDYPSGLFFSKSNDSDLAKKIEEQLIYPAALVHFDYQINIQHFAQKFMLAVHSLFTNS